MAHEQKRCHGGNTRVGPVASAAEVDRVAEILNDEEVELDSVSIEQLVGILNVVADEGNRYIYDNRK